MSNVLTHDWEGADSFGQAVDPLNSVTCPSSLGEPLVSLRQVNDTIHS